MHTLRLNDLAFLGFSRGATPTVFPTDFAGLKVWYRSSDLALNDGDPVSTWTDRSANGNDSTGVLTTRPTFKTSIVGTTPVLRFDGIDDFLTIGSQLSFTPNFTCIALIKITATFSPFAGSTVSHSLAATADDRAHYSDTVTAVFSTAFSTAQTDLKTVGIRRSNPNVIFRDNKNACGTNNVGATNFLVGLIGKTTLAGGLFFTGDMIEFMAWDNSLSDANVDALYDSYFKILYPTLP